MKNIKKVVAVFLIIGGVRFTSKESILSGVLIIILGLIIFPTISNFIKEKIILWNKKGIRYSSYAFFFILIGVFSDSKTENSSNKRNTHSKYVKYLNKVDENINSLTKEARVSRQNSISSLQKTGTYKTLVNEKTVSIEYLPLLTAINDGLRQTYTDSNGKELFGIEQTLVNRIEQSINGDDKVNFVVQSIVLSTPNKGGYTKELVEVFLRYKNKFGIYGLPQKVYSVDQSSQEEIKFPYNFSSIFYHINQTDKNFESVYLSNKKGISNWLKQNNSQKYIHNHLATKRGYTEYAKQNHPNNPYLLKVDKEVWAEDLYNLYEANEVLADEKYKGKKLAVTGTIEEISKDFTGDPYVLLKISFLKNVRCEFDDEHLKEISKLRKGQKIVIIGECTGLILTNVMIDDCNIWNE